MTNDTMTRDRYSDGYGGTASASDRLEMLRLDLLREANADVFIRFESMGGFCDDHYCDLCPHPRSHHRIDGKITEVYFSDGSVACNIVSDDGKSFHLGPLYGTRVWEKPVR